MFFDTSMSSDLAIDSSWVFFIGVPMTGSSGDDSFSEVPSSCTLISLGLPESASEFASYDSGEEEMFKLCVYILKFIRDQKLSKIAQVIA